MRTGFLAARARLRARDLMTSTCVIYANGVPTTDPTTGEVTSNETVLWTGPCRARPAARGLTALADEVGGAETYRYDYRVSIPFEVNYVLEGHRLEFTASPDQSLVGLVLEIDRVDRGDDISARRLLCQRVA